jgi:acyl-coenzyme A synthetase/AMP-(fatty) acid ligase
MIFYQDDKRLNTITYDSLLDKINNYNNYESIIKEDNADVFFIKLIFNVCHNIDTLIIDNDTFINVQEEDVKEFDFQVDENIVKPFFNSWNDLLNQILKTKCNISIFTSGTTGQPKKITHTASKFIKMARVSEKYTENIWAYVYNPTHMAGLQVFFQALLNKNRIIYLFQCTKNEFVISCKENHITNVSATPTFYKLLSPFNFKLKFVKKCTLGGEKSSTKLIDSLKNVFPNASIFNIYASTEAGSLFISKGDAFKVIDNLKHKVKFIENEIVIHKTLLGVFDTTEWFYTGDIVEFIDKEKTMFKITSRKSDTINVGGNRINLLEVEQEVNNIKGVLNAVVYAIDNSVLGKIIVTEIITSIVYSKKEIKTLLKDKLPSYKIPTKIKFVEELEATRTGKIKRTEK